MNPIEILIHIMKEAYRQLKDKPQTEENFVSQIERIIASYKSVDLSSYVSNARSFIQPALDGKDF